MRQIISIGIWGFSLWLGSIEASTSVPDSVSSKIREVRSAADLLSERWNEILTGGGAYIRHGEYSQWHENGNLKLTGRYNRGERHGRWFAYDEEGNLRLEATFEDGERQGLWVLYDESGNVEREAQFNDSLLDSLADRAMSPPIGRTIIGVGGGSAVSLVNTASTEQKEEEGLVDLLEIDGSGLPLPKRCVQPVYPEDALKQEKEGHVIVNIMIGEDGKVRRIGQVTGPRIFHEAAREAARQWEFSLATKEGEPVKVWISLPLDFWLIKDK